MRPWFAMRVAEVPFEETVISLNAPDFKERVLAVSGSGRVPALADGDIKIWESLAIVEYLAEKFPAAGLWPRDAGARAHARAIANEMHAGFLPLRRQCPMNFWRPVIKMPLGADAAANVRRIDGIWSACRGRHSAGGPFLFGAFTAADAMYAPVVSRFHTYAIDVSPIAQAYIEVMMALPAWHEWQAAACAEAWVLAEFEVDWPTVQKR